MEWTHLDGWTFSKSVRAYNHESWIPTKLLSCRLSPSPSLTSSFLALFHQQNQQESDRGAISQLVLRQNPVPSEWVSE